MEDIHIYITCRKSWVIVFPSNLMCFLFIYCFCACVRGALFGPSFIDHVSSKILSLTGYSAPIYYYYYFKFKFRVQLLITLLYLNSRPFLLPQSSLIHKKCPPNCHENHHWIHVQHVINFSTKKLWYSLQPPNQVNQSIFHINIFHVMNCIPFS